MAKYALIRIGSNLRAEARGTQDIDLQHSRAEPRFWIEPGPGWPVPVALIGLRCAGAHRNATVGIKLQSAAVVGVLPGRTGLESCQASSDAEHPLRSINQ